MADIQKGITITFRGNTASFDASIGNIEKAMKVVQADTKQLNKELKLDPTNLDKLTDKMKNLQSLLKLNQEAVGQYRKKILDAIAPSEKLANSDEYKKLNDQIRQAEKNVSDYTKQLDDARKIGLDVSDPTKWAELNQNYAKANDEMNELNKQMFDLVRTDYTVLDWKNYADGQRQYRQGLGQINSLMMSIETTGEKIKNNGALVSAAEYEKQSKALKKVSNQFGKVASATKYVSMAAAGILGASIKYASDFETEWKKVEKVVEETGTTTYDDLKEQIRQMARDIPVDIETITDAFANAGQLGVGADNLKDFVETILRLDSATNLTADDAATTIAQLYNVMGANLDTVDNFANALVRLGNKTATTEKDILEMSAAIAASARQVGFSEAQVLGLADALAAAGLNPSSAGSSISRTLTDIDKALAKGTNSWYKYSKSQKKWVQTSTGAMIKQYAKLLGIVGNSDKEILAKFRKMWEQDSASVFEGIIAGMSKAVEKGQNLNTLFEQLGITGLKQDATIKALVNSYPLLADAMDMATSSFENGNDAVDESEKSWDTFVSKVKKLKTNLKQLAATLGEMILPFVEKLVDKVTVLVQKFQEMPSWVQSLITGFLGITAVISPILGIVSKVVGLFSSWTGLIATLTESGKFAWLLGIMTKISSFFTKIGGLLGKVGAFFKGLGPWGIVLGGLIGLVVTFSDEVDTLMYALLGADVWDRIKEVWQSIVDFFGRLWGIIKEIITEMGNFINYKLKEIGKAITNLAIKRGMSPKTDEASVSSGGLGVNANNLVAPYSGGLGVANRLIMAGGTSISLATSINVSNNGTPINEAEIRRWGNVISDVVSKNLGGRW